MLRDNTMKLFGMIMLPYFDAVCKHNRPTRYDRLRQAVREGEIHDGGAVQSCRKKETAFAVSFLHKYGFYRWPLS